MALTKISRSLLDTGVSDSSDATAITIDSSENVGIGTTSPAAKLQIQTQTDGNAAFQNSTSVTGGVKINCFNNAANASSPFELDGSTLQFNIAASEKMRINSSGNVGIGTTSPDRMLHVKGTATSTVAKFANTGNTVYIELNAADQVGGDAGYIAYNNTKDMGFWTDDTERMKIDSSGNLYFNSGFGSVGAAYGVRAWVNFNGIGTVSIRESGNVTSITDHGVGQYTCNFSSAMPDGDYVICGGAGYTAQSNQIVVSQNRAATAPATGSCRISVTYANLYLLDVSQVTVAFIR